MPNIPVVFCFDKRIILGASVAIKSLIDSANDDTTYDIRIFHSDIGIKDQKNITLLTKGTKHTIAFHYIDSNIFKGAPHNNMSWTELVYYRLLIPEILKEYDKVIYSDVDVMFKGDLSDVYNIDLTGYEMAAVPVEVNNKDTMICHTYFPENTNDKIYVSGFLLFNSKLMREEKTVNKFFDVIGKINMRLKYYDLDTMNIALNRFFPLSIKYCVFQSLIYNDEIQKANEYNFLNIIYSDKELIDAKNNPIIIHYAGKMGKPWRMKKPYKDYQEYINKLPNELRKYTFRDIRKRFFSKV